jgi:penicillin amidase
MPEVNMPRAPSAALLASLFLLALGACSDGGGEPRFEVAGGTGLTAEVKVTFDRLGVPHLVASSDADAAFALGYVQARARFWQMDVFRRTARGTLSELLGPAVLDSDRFFRTVFTSSQTATLPGGGTSRRIEDVVRADLVARDRADLVLVLERYAAGVNRWIDDARAGRNGAALPPQYRGDPVAGTAATLAPWTVEDTLAIQRLQTWNLSAGLEEELLAGELAAKLATARPALLADLARTAPAVPSYVIPGAPGAGAAPARLAASVAAKAPAGAGATRLAAAAGHLAGAGPALARARAAVRAVANPLGAGERAGSNNWVVSGDRGNQGRALVANDPHLALLNPPTFMLVHVTTPTRDVAGVAFPGTPVVVIGHNGKVGWGVTVVGYDVTDLYLERLAGVGTATVTASRGAGTVPVARVTESFRVRGEPAPRTFDVLFVEGHGPVIPQTVAPVPGQPADVRTAVSVRWVGQAPTQEAAAFFDLNGARTAGEAFEAVRQFGVGAQNFVFADTAGAIGYFPHALVPRRAATGTTPPWLPMPSDGAHEWDGFLADADLPQLHPSSPPAQGFIATANADIDGRTADGDPLVNPGGRAYLYAFVDLGYRHARIQEVLAARTASGPVLFDDMARLQADHESLPGRTLVPPLLERIDGRTLSPAAEEARVLLSQWSAGIDGHRYGTPTGPVGPTVAVSPVPPQIAAVASTIFHAWLVELAAGILADDLAPFAIEVGDIPGEQLVRYLTALYAPVTDPAPPLATGEALCDAAGTAEVESCADAAVAALEAAVTRLAADPRLAGRGPGEWYWGRVHQAVFRLDPLQQLFDLFGRTEFAEGPVPNDGGLYTVDVANFSLRPGTDFTQRSGPNVRFSAEMDPEGVRWRAVLPGGQDQDPASPLSTRNRLEAWLANQPGDQPYTAAEVAAAAALTGSFRP